MRSILLIIGLCFCINNSAVAQTKKESSQWLEFYLAKYYGDDMSSPMSSVFRERRLAYTWHSYQYYFDSCFLYVLTTAYKVDSAGNQETTGRQKDVINLKRIIKVECEIHTENGRVADYATINLVFNDPDFDKNKKVIEHAVIKYDDIENRRITGEYSYSGAYRINSYDKETINGKMEDRFKRAFEHLISLWGGKIIKDVF